MTKTAYLIKKYHRWWVRVKVPQRVRHLIGKYEFKKNLYTSDLNEANKRKYKIIAEFKEMIILAEKRLDGSLKEISKEDQIRHFALECRKLSEMNPEEDITYFSDAIEGEVEGLYGEAKANVIFNSSHHQWTGELPDSKVVKAITDAYLIADPSSNPLSIVSKLYLSELGDLKPSTIRRKKKHLDEFIQWSGNIDISNVDKKLAGDYITLINSAKNPAPATLRNLKSDLSSLFGWAEGRGYIEHNPIQNIKISNKSKSKKKRKPWSNEYIIAFLSHEKITMNDFSATAIALFTGMRIEEICQLKGKDIEEGCIKIEEGKTNASSRKIPIHSVLLLIIEKLISRCGKDYLLRGLNPGGLDGKRSFYFSRRQSILRREVGLPEGVVFHTLRNTFATRMENAGVPKNHISQLMGHEDDNMALDVYSGGLAIEPLRESINKLNYGSGMNLLIKNLFTKFL